MSFRYSCHNIKCPERSPSKSPEDTGDFLYRKVQFFYQHPYKPEFFSHTINDKAAEREDNDYESAGDSKNSYK